MVIATLILNLTLNIINVTMPVLMKDSGQGAGGYGLFEATLAFGMLLGIACIGLLGDKIPLAYKISFGIGLKGVGFLLLAFGGFSWFIVGAFVFGSGLGLSEVAVMTFAQRVIPDGMRGKVLGLHLSSGALGLTLGAWLGGQGIQHTELAYMLSAIATLILCVVWTFLNVQRDRTSRSSTYT